MTYIKASAQIQKHVCLLTAPAVLCCSKRFTVHTFSRSTNAEHDHSIQKGLIHCVGLNAGNLLVTPIIGTWVWQRHQQPMSMDI